MFFKNCKETENGVEKELIVQCECNTHSFHIMTFDNEPEYYLELWTQDFYGDKNSSLFNRIIRRLKIIWFAIRGKEYQLTELCLTKKDIDELICCLQEIKNSRTGGEK